MQCHSLASVFGKIFHYIPAIRLIGSIFRENPPLSRPPGLSNLCLLPNLRSLRLVDYRVVPGRTIDISSLKFVFLSRGNADIWIPLLRPDQLRELIIPLHPGLLLQFNLLPSFPCTQKLVVRLDLSQMAHNFRLLSKFPALQVLSMLGDHRDHVYEEEGHMPAPGSFPLLKEYTGISETLHTFLPLPTLTHLTISYCQPHEIITKLRGIRSPNSITSLRISFRSINNAVFHDFCRFFPALTRLRVDICDAEGAAGLNDDEYDWETEYDWEIPKFLETLPKTSSLPPQLKQLALFWRTECEYSEAPPEYVNFRDAIMQKYPALNALWMGLYGFTFRCRKISDGTVLLEEAMADDDHETVRRMCKQFDLSWDAVELGVETIAVEVPSSNLVHFFR
ncbi:hypothetical protein FB451DRAFT_1292068 [Mycena latifolia]|nr:hypothetical protein FB451DRAFT_1292068 [Mycena latifolia]